MAVCAVRIRAARTGRPATSSLSGLLVCASWGSRFIAVDQSFYGCASLKQGGLAACTNTGRLKRTTLEQRILAEIEAEILSDEALERVQKGLQSILGRAAINQQEIGTPKLAKLEEEAQELRALVKQGRLSPPAAQAALDAIEHASRVGFPRVARRASGLRGSDENDSARRRALSRRGAQRFATRGCPTY
jgi:hypothetical protein